MAIPTAAARLDEAARSREPAAALPALAAALKAEGMSQAEMYDLFDVCREAHTHDADEAVYDAILDTMDFIVGWCSPHVRLFDQALVGPSLDQSARTFVQPFHLWILHGNYARMLGPSGDDEERRQFLRAFETATGLLDTSVVERLFDEVNWRPRIAAAWWCGLKGWRQYADRIGDLLVESELVYAGQGYCLALACFADERGAFHLCRYLDTYLPQPDKHYDQHWAVPALLWIDRKLGTARAADYIRPGGPWDLWVGAGCRANSDRFALARVQREFDAVMTATESLIESV